MGLMQSAVLKTVEQARVVLIGLGLSAVALVLCTPRASAIEATLVAIGSRAIAGMHEVGPLPGGSVVYSVNRMPKPDEIVSDIEIEALATSPFIAINDDDTLDLPNGKGLVLAISGSIARDEPSGQIHIRDAASSIALATVTDQLSNAIDRFRAPGDMGYRVVVVMMLEDRDRLSSRALGALQSLARDVPADAMLVSIASGDSVDCDLGKVALLPRLLWGGGASVEPHDAGVAAIAGVATSKDGLLSYFNLFLDQSQPEPGCRRFNIFGGGKDREVGPSGPNDISLVRHQRLDPAIERLAVSESALRDIVLASPPQDQQAAIAQYYRNCLICFELTKAEASHNAADTQAAVGPVRPNAGENGTSNTAAPALRGSEAQLWRRIEQSDARADFELYLARCFVCEFRAKAEAQLQDFDAVLARRATERLAFETAKTARDLTALRAYSQGCEFCAYRNEALALAKAIDDEQVAKAEQALSDSLIASPSVQGIRDYLDTCRFCPGQAALADLLTTEMLVAASLAPCLEAAGLPQIGGPRFLRDIDIDAARDACQAHIAEFADSPLAAMTLGRIAQAQGDLASAARAYDAGVAAGLSHAFGLKAHLLYVDPNGFDDQLDQITTLATQGAAMDDWLSRELLTLLYSQDLVPGKGINDAEQQARYLAERGVATGHFYMGFFHLNGLGVERSDVLAIEQFEKAVALGYVSAFVSLADLYETQEEFDKAAELYWRALNDGNQEAKARFTSQLLDRDKQVLAQIQRFLTQAGHYDSDIDGLPGPGTERAFQSLFDALAERGAAPNANEQPDTTE